MSDLDKLARRHADTVRGSLADAEPPPLDTLTPARRVLVSRGVLTALAAAALVVLVLLPLAFLRSPTPPTGTVEPDPDAVAPPDTVGAPADPFDLHSFLISKLDGEFRPDEVDQRVAVVVFAPEDLSEEVDLVLLDLPELEGISYVLAEEVAAAADRFANRHGTEQLEGGWVAYGLIPRFEDSPVAEWEQTLRGIEGIFITQVEFERPPATLDEGWEGWQLVAELPFTIESGAIVEAVDTGIVVVGPTTTRIVGFDGSSTTGGAPPVSIPAACCGTVRGFSTGDSLVLIDYIDATTWILDTQGLTWREADPKPTRGNNVGGWLLGAVVIDGELFVIDAASRIGDAASAAAALNLETGTWRSIDPVPSPISVGGVTTDGERVIAAGTRQDHNNMIIGDPSPVAYAYTDTDGWRQLPSIPIHGQASTVVWVEGTGVLAWNYGLESAVFDQSNTWRGTGEVPMSPSECYPQSDPATIGVVGRCGGIAWFDPATEAWTPIWPESAQAFNPRFTVSPNRIVAFVEVARDQTQLLTYPLPPKQS